jgi:hypothetical protein
MCTGWAFWKPYIGQAVGGRFAVMVLIGEAPLQQLTKRNTHINKHILVNISSFHS